MSARSAVAGAATVGVLVGVLGSPAAVGTAQDLAERHRLPLTAATFTDIPNWDVFQDGTTADVATDSYRRYREDIALVKAMGVDAYRFSISWSRIVPDGVSAQPLIPAGWDGVNRAGIDYYSRLIDALLERGVTPSAYRPMAPRTK